MARFTLRISLLFCLVFLCLIEGKKQGESKSDKRHKDDDSADDTTSEEKDFMKTSLTETSLPGTAVAQHALPAATKDSDVLKVKQNAEGDDSVESGDSEIQSGSGDEAQIASKVESVNKPSKVKSRILIEKDRNKIAETVKKSKVARIKEKLTKNSASKSQTSGKVKQDVKTSEKTTTKKSKQADQGDKNDKEKQNKKKKVEKEGKKRSKESHHHHHHHHHHRHHPQQEKKSKRPVVENEANKPKIDYPTFNWTKNVGKVKTVAQIPGYGSNMVPSYTTAQKGQAVQLSQIPAVIQAAAPVAAQQRDSVPSPVDTLLNGTIKNQADLARLDQASITSDNSAQKDHMESQKAQSTAENSTAVDLTNNPAAATIASDTGEVPSNVTTKLDIKVPDSIPSRCMSLIKSYTNAELTLHDYLKLMKKCKKADADFNAVHPNGVAMLRDSISRNGPYLTKEAYKYALERVRNYVPSSKEREAADMILAKWRTNSFGNRDKINNSGDVPDAIKSFMTGQVSSAEKAAADEQNIEQQTQKAIDTAKSYILGTITGHTGDLNKQENKENRVGEKKNTIVANTKQTVLNVISAAKSLLSSADNGHAVVLTPGNNKPAILPLPDVKKQQIATVADKKSKALDMAKAADVLNSAMMSQLSPNVVTSSEKVSSNLVAALRDMGSGPEPSGQPGVKSSVQKRNLVPSVGHTKRRRRRSLFRHLLTRYKEREVLFNRKRRQVREKPFEIDNPSERSKLNKPVIPAPKLMDKIRDMSMVIATP